MGGGGAQEESGGLPVGVKCCYIYDIQQFFGEIESLHYLSQQGAACRVRYENTYDKIYRNNYFMYKQPCVMRSVPNSLKREKEKPPIFRSSKYSQKRQ